MSEIEIMPGSICVLEHKCAVCDRVALSPGHGTRGRNWQRDGISNCPENFLVRCAACSRENRRKPDQIYAIEHPVKTWEELEELEQKPNVVYEIM